MSGRIGSHLGGTGEMTYLQEYPMRSAILTALAVLLVSFSAPAQGADRIDSRVVQVRMPDEDVEIAYVERRECFTVELLAKSASVEGVNFYVGDGTVAVELEAHASDGIFLQGKTKLQDRHFFKKGATVKLLPGYKRASALAPGTVYVMLPGVTFEVPK